jgi:hypothetical protein
MHWHPRVEVRPRKNKRAVDLVSDALSFRREPDDAVEYASFSINHMMPSFAFTMAQGRQHQFRCLKGRTL